MQIPELAGSVTQLKIFGGRSDVTFHIFTKQILQFWIDNYVCVNIIFQLLM